jgi:hypothetical protein
MRVGMAKRGSKPWIVAEVVKSAISNYALETAVCAVRCKER